MIFNTSPAGPRSVWQMDMKVADDIIENEPMVFQSSAGFARANGGVLTEMVLSALQLIIPDKYDALRIDTRSTLLGEGDIASRGGWHCDFMSETDYSTITGEGEGVEHYMLVSGPPFTEFVNGRDIKLNKIEPPFSWKDVNRALSDYPYNADRYAWAVRPMTLYKFDAFELHRAVPSKNKDLVWRWFFRASFFPNGTEYANKVRKQVQVYR